MFVIFCVFADNTHKKDLILFKSGQWIMGMISTPGGAVPQHM